jgi:hypothetical protein
VEQPDRAAGHSLPSSSEVRNRLCAVLACCFSTGITVLLLMKLGFSM